MCSSSVLVLAEQDSVLVHPTKEIPIQPSVRLESWTPDTIGWVHIMRTSAAAPGLALAKARSWSWVALVARAFASSLAVLATSCSLFLLLASLSFSATSSCTR